MAKRKGAIIPDPVNPSGTYRRVLCIPASPEWIALVTGALYPLTQDWYWDEQTGDVDAVVDRAKQFYFEYQDQNGSCDPVTLWVGKIEMSASLADPPAGWLECLGQSLLRTAYPALFTALGTQWGAVDGTHFTIPDARGRVFQGQGAQDGNAALNGTWQMGNQIGEQKHVLTIAELAAHTHDYATGAGSAPVGSAPVYSSGVNLNPKIATTSTGSGTAHNTMQPTTTCRYFVYAGV